MGQVQTKNKKKNKGVRQKFESNEEHFIRNGAILLEKQIALSQGKDVFERLKILSEDEIKNATNNYDPNFIVLRLHDANVYKGIVDDRLVVIKTPPTNPTHELVDRFLTDVSIAMVIRHDNMNKIYGCCLETYIPIIVHHCTGVRLELHRYLHVDSGLGTLLKWRGRLNVAIDIAYALSYMHNALSKPVVHRDVKSLCIMVDSSSFHALLANVCHSVSITPGKKWPVYGTPGYIDPEYVETREVSDKCDVYSFGVLMLEMLTTREPTEMARCGKDLVIEFVSDVEKNGIIEMIDKSFLEEGNIGEIQMFSKLALNCVAKKGEERPNMTNVAEELRRIQDLDNNF